MTAFGFIIGVLNIGLAFACAMWWFVDKTGSGVPIVAAIFSFNMAMIWLLIAGIRRAEGNIIVWSGMPSLAAIILTAVLAVVLASQERPRTGPLRESDFKLWKCPDGSEVWGSERPCEGGSRIR